MPFFSFPNTLQDFRGKTTKADNLLTVSLYYRTQTRGRTGMDFTPLVFETSASTDSAIWAIVFPLRMQR